MNYTQQELESIMKNKYHDKKFKEFVKTHEFRKFIHIYDENCFIVLDYDKSFIDYTINIGLLDENYVKKVYNMFYKFITHDIFYQKLREKDIADRIQLYNLSNDIDDIEQFVDDILVFYNNMKNGFDDVKSNNSEIIYHMMSFYNPIVKCLPDVWFFKKPKDTTYKFPTIYKTCYIKENNELKYLLPDVMLN